MPEHATLKLLHQLCALLSVTGFTLRGGLMLAGSGLLYRRWMRTWPHVIDTLLLATGVWMTVNLQLNPVNSPWLAAKLLALVAYIGLGFVALRLGATKALRSVALLAALACFGYIAMVATTRSVLPL